MRQKEIVHFFISSWKLLEWYLASVLCVQYSLEFLHKIVFHKGKPFGKLPSDISVLSPNCYQQLMLKKSQIKGLFQSS